MNLRKLDLQDNYFEREASHTALFRVLVFAKSLVYLDLGSCEMKDNGIKEVCHALMVGRSTLEHLDLSSNQVTENGAKCIADYICENGGSLKTLCLDDNRLKNKGVQLIASAFPASEGGHNIEEIRLDCCKIGAIGAQALIAAHGSSGVNLPKLRSIQLNHNFFTDDVLRELEVAFDYRLGNLDMNEPDGNSDDELSDEDEEDENEDENEDGKDGEPVTDSVDNLAQAMTKSLLV